MLPVVVRMPDFRGFRPKLDGLGGSKAGLGRGLGAATRCRLPHTHTHTHTLAHTQSLALSRSRHSSLPLQPLSLTEPGARKRRDVSNCCISCKQTEFVPSGGRGEREGGVDV